MNIDSLLDLVSRLLWVVFLGVTIFLFVRRYREGGFVYALRRTMGWRISAFLITVLVVTIISAAIVFIQPQEVAVVVSALNPNGYRPDPLRSGLQFVVPLAEEAVRYPIYWQNYTMSSRPLEGEVVGDDSIAARSADGQSVIIDVSVVFRIDANQAVRIHIDWQNRYITDLIRPRTRSEVRSLAAQFTADEINSDERQNLEVLLNTEMGRILEEHGFILDSLLVRNIAFSPDFAQAVEDKQIALQREEQRRREANQIRALAEGRGDEITILARARADAILLEAAARANARVLAARGERKALIDINNALARAPTDLLTYQYINRLAPNIRVMLVPSGSPVILPLPNQTINEALAVDDTRSVPITSTTTFSPGLTLLNDGNITP